MSLVLAHPRPVPVRGLALVALVLIGLLPSATSFAPTLARSVAAATHAIVCHCAHCPGGAKCCCAHRPAACPEATR